MKNIFYGIGIAIIIFLAGLLSGKYFFSTHDIKVKKEIQYQTVYLTPKDLAFNLENFNIYKACHDNKLTFTYKTEGDWLTVQVGDDCKSAETKYEIGTYGNWKIYGLIGLTGIIAGGIIGYKYLK
jgi:hypothetical protein